MSARPALWLAALIMLSCPARGQQAISINTAEIVAATTAAATDLACLNFRINGVCLYLICTPVSCSIETSLQFRHFHPALIVTAYNTLGASPWTEIRTALGAAQVAASDAQFAALGIDPASVPGGGRFADDAPSLQQDDTPPDRSKHLVFKEAEVIGAPGSALSVAATLGLPLACPATDIRPFFPYFLSGFDALAWRSGLTELVFPATFVPGLREIGTFPVNSWGPVHPRQGFLFSPEDPKAAAVIAQRAADIATRPFSPHVYVPVGSFPGQQTPGLDVFLPEPVIEHEPENSTWQRLLPVTETTCDVFGLNDTATIFEGFSTNQGSQSGDYAFALWRPYRCCETRGLLLETIEIGS